MTLTEGHQFWTKEVGLCVVVKRNMYCLLRLQSQNTTDRVVQTTFIHAFVHSFRYIFIYSHSRGLEVLDQGVGSLVSCEASLLGLQTAISHCILTRSFLF